LSLVRFGVLFTLLIILVANATRAAAQEAPRPKASPTPDRGEEIDDVIRVDITLVTVPVRVMDRNGKYVPDMRQEEFRVFEDGVEQQLAYFAPVESAFTIVLMIDVSDSTERSLKDIKKAAYSFIAQLRENDEVIIITFDNRLTALNQPTSDREALRTILDGIRPGGGTRIYDVLDVVFRRLLNQIKGRKAVVLFTDGVDIDSLATAGQILHRAEESEALIYTVRYNTYGAIKEKIRAANTSSPVPIIGAEKGSREEDYIAARAFLNGLADKTGALMYETRDIRKLDEGFAQIAAELRWQYSLGYYPSAPGEPGQRRKIKVRVSRSNLGVRARSSYVYDRDTRAQPIREK
jgi:VWFA-related protein